MYLNCHSYYSMRYGVLSVEELVEIAVTHGIKSLALTDIHNVSACYDFVKLCKQKGIHPVVGMEFRRNDELLYIALAKNRQGFQEINSFYSQYAHSKAAFPDIAPLWENAYIVYPWARQGHATLSENEYLGIHQSEIQQLFRSRYHHRQDKLVILQPLTFLDEAGHQTHRFLRAIDHNVVLSKLSYTQQASTRETFVAPDTLLAAFKGFPNILKNTENLLANCCFEVDFGISQTKQSFTGDKYADTILLEQLAHEGCLQRYGPHHKEAFERLQRELAIIDQLDFNAYFLITWDFVRYGQHRGFFHVGRGSGANSVVAYCLGITDVDPIQLDLYFERFLNPKRQSPPDFDIDYSHKDRDEVIRYVLKRYRESHTAMLATYSTFKAKASIREIGKTFGLPKGEIDQLIHFRDQQPHDLSITAKQVLQFARNIQGFPNHFSVHAGGILISEAPIHAYSPTEIPPKGFPITQFDMYVAEDIGLYKFDVLSQRGLGHMRSAVEIVQENRGEAVAIQEVEKFKQDAKAKALLEKGHTTGCFYVESPAMRGLLKKLGCDNYLTLVAASSVIRPGVARSGMMGAYIERHNGAIFEYPHPKIGELLDETYGVMVYQEDVLKVVHGYAGLSLADADLLRRAMSGKSRDNNEFEIIKAKFLDACKDKGYPEAISQEIWRQIESFAGYSFSKAHSASFAVESFQSLYLKAHYPLEFMVGVINNFGGFYDTEIYVHEAKMLGANIHPPCVNTSTLYTRIIGKDIYLGFVHLKDLQKQLAQKIELVRVQQGVFSDMADFARKIPVSVEQLTILIRVGAFRFMEKTKPALLWEMRLYTQRKREGQANVLFPPDTPHFTLPELVTSPLEDAYDEMELLGFPLASPFTLLSEEVHQHQLCTSSQLPECVGQRVRMLGYLVCIKPVKTINGKRMQFANFLDTDGRLFDVTVFPPETAKYPFTGRAIYAITGKAVEEFGHYSLEMTHLQKLLYLPDPRVGEEPLETPSHRPVPSSEQGTAHGRTI